MTAVAAPAAPDWSAFVKAAGASYYLAGEAILYATGRYLDGTVARFVVLDPWHERTSRASSEVEDGAIARHQRCDIGNPEREVADRSSLHLDVDRGLPLSLEGFVHANANERGDEPVTELVHAPFGVDRVHTPDDHALGATRPFGERHRRGILTRDRDRGQTQNQKGWSNTIHDAEMMGMPGGEASCDVATRRHGNTQDRYQ